MQITFWGVRGSTPGCNPDQQKVGGHTSCVSVECDQHLIIFDAGTGLTNLGNWLLGTAYREIHLFLSHAHFDHILGLPFFKPFWNPEFKIHLYSGPLCGASTLQSFLKEVLFQHPLFPVTFENLKAPVYFGELKAEQDIILKGVPIQLKTFPLNHPGLSLGYRLTYQNKSLCYLSDMEHSAQAPEPALVEFSKGADLLIYDATYTDEEYAKYVGWGHSTWQQGVKLAQQAQAKRVAFYHHAPHHTDDQMHLVERQAQSLFKGAFVARQNLQITL